MSPNRYCKVATAYSSAYPNPLKLRKGASITIGEKDCEWDGWLWCSDEKDVQGWVPESYVDIDGDSGTMLRDYDATELTVEVGEDLEIIVEESGWLQCRKSDGSVGWIPSSTVRIVQE